MSEKKMVQWMFEDVLPGGAIERLQAEARTLVQIIDNNGYNRIFSRISYADSATPFEIEAERRDGRARASTALIEIEMAARTVVALAEAYRNSLK